MRNSGTELDAANALPTGSRRYSRLETCATKKLAGSGHTD